MLHSVLFGLIGIVLLTAFCLIGAFLVPQNAYWFMTPKAIKILEDAGISRKHGGRVWLPVWISGSWAFAF